MGKVLLTGAELGGTTLPESETDHPLGSPGGVPKVVVGAAVVEVIQGYTLERSTGVKGIGAPLTEEVTAGAWSWTGEPPELIWPPLDLMDCQLPVWSP
jgi:hypothetical protein